MKNFILIGALLVIWTQAHSYAQDPLTGPQASKQKVVSANPVPDPQSKIDPEKEAAIRQLLSQMGYEIVEHQMLEDLGKTLKPLMANSLPPGEYRDKFIELWFEKFSSKFGVQLFELAVPVYDKYLSTEEIKGMIQFYGTPLGQKALRLMPLLTGELQEKGEKWGEMIGEESAREVLLEHPDLAKALEEAQKRSEQPK